MKIGAAADGKTEFPRNRLDFPGIGGRIGGVNAFDGKKQEIQTYETNLSFFRTSSKKGNSLVADIEKKVARLKEDLEEIGQKIKAVNEQIKAEKAEK